MLYPRENRVRGVIDLGGVWNFKLGDEKEPGDSFVMGEDTELMAVPASYNDQKDDPKYQIGRASCREIPEPLRLGVLRAEDYGSVLSEGTASRAPL